MTAAANITDDLCNVCDGRIECAPTAILLISLVHTLYGHIGPEPDYFGKKYRRSTGMQVETIGSDDDIDTQKDNLWHTKFHIPQDVKESRRKLEHEESNEVPMFDFVVVGGGTAGCVVASRLSENNNWKVLLLEAGPEEPKITLIPALTSEFRGSSLDWQYTMRPKKGFCQNRMYAGCEIVQGRVLGGTSSINDMAYMRGNPTDYEDWAAAGNEGWGWEDVLPYFKYSEGNYDKDISRNKFYHSTQGPLDVGRYPYVDENVDVLLSALNELGYNYTDINGNNQLGFMRIQSMSYIGERVSAHTAFIEPIKKVRPNIEIVTEALVTKILLDTESGQESLKAVGVEYLKNGTKYRVMAKKEIIVSAGAINSPKLLMQSGVGPKAYLEYLNIDVYRDMPVGANFHDHVSVCLPMIKLGKTSTKAKFAEKLRDITTYYGKGIGPLSANFQVVLYLESNIYKMDGAPDIEVRFKGHNSNIYYDMIEICVSLLTPRSRGQIILNASDPILGKPLIYPNFLKYTADEQKLLEGIQEATKLFDTDVFKAAGFEFDPKMILDNECKENKKATEDFWRCIIKYFSSPLHNYVGTCKMGLQDDTEAVVDNRLRVHGVSNLRVVDASVIPKIPRGSTAAPVIMIAERASDFIKKKWY